MSRILADKVTNYNNDGPFEAEKGINIPLARPLQVSGNSGASGQYLVSTGVGLTWQNLPTLFSGNYTDLTNKPVLFSGNYNDLTNKPPILSLDIAGLQDGQYLKYNGTNWINSNLPDIYVYSLTTTNYPTTESIELNLVDQFFVKSTIAISGDNGISVSTDENGSITITSPNVVEYDADVAKNDISSMFLNGTNTGITYSYNPLTKTIDSSVSLAEQLIYTLFSSSDEENQAKIYLDNGTGETGFVDLVGTNGIELTWDIGTSTITFSKTDPDPYVLPAATSSTLGGVIPDASDFNIDGFGNLTVNFPTSGISLSDLSIASEAAASGNGNLSYDNTTGQFTYTPPAFSIDDLTDVSISGTPTNNSLLQWQGTQWNYVGLYDLGLKLDDLDLVGDLSSVSQYDILTWNGTQWQNSPVYLGNQSIHFLEDVGPGLSTDPNMTIEENSVLAWDAQISQWVVRKLMLKNFDVGSLPTDQQILVWNSANNYWSPTSISTLVPSAGNDPTFGTLEITNSTYEGVTNNFNTSLTPSSGTLSVNTAASPIIVGALTAAVTTWAFTNVDISGPKAVTVSLIIDSNSLYTYGDACSVNGTNITGGVRWAGGIAPAATNNEDIVSFTIITDGAGNTRVYGSSTLNYS